MLLTAEDESFTFRLGGCQRAGEPAVGGVGRQCPLGFETFSSRKKAGKHTHLVGAVVLPFFTLPHIKFLPRSLLLLSPGTQVENLNCWSLTGLDREASAVLSQAARRLGCLPAAQQASLRS